MESKPAHIQTERAVSEKPRKKGVAGTVLGSDQRTFCVIPKKDVARDWKEAINDKATDETMAHMTMFEPKENPGYNKMAHDAKDMIASWLKNDWYESSTSGDKINE